MRRRRGRAARSRAEKNDTRRSPNFGEKVKTESRAYRITNADAVNTGRECEEYGLSVPEYTAMVARQNGICVVCLKVAEKGRMGLCIDHDHRRRKLRDLLCGRCNLGVGNFKDDLAAMRRGADYVDYWKWRHADPRNTGPVAVLPAGTGTALRPEPQPSNPQPPTGEDMTPTDEPTDESKTSRMMHRAILHELLQPFVPDPPPPVDMLQAVSRAIVVKASQGDMTAAKEVLDRIDGKTPAAAAPAAPETPKELTPARETCW